MTKWFCRESIVGTIKTLMIGDNIEKRYIVSKKRITSVVLFLLKKKEDKNNVKTTKKRNTNTTDRTDL